MVGNYSRYDIYTVTNTLYRSTCPQLSAVVSAEDLYSVDALFCACGALGRGRFKREGVCDD